MFLKYFSKNLKQLYSFDNFMIILLCIHYVEYIFLVTVYGQYLFYFWTIFFSLFICWHLNGDNKSCTRMYIFKNSPQKYKQKIFKCIKGQNWKQISCKVTHPSNIVISIVLWTILEFIISEHQSKRLSFPLRNSTPPREKRLVGIFK